MNRKPSAARLVANAETPARPRFICNARLAHATDAVGTWILLETPAGESIALTHFGYDRDAELRRVLDAISRA